MTALWTNLEVPTEQEPKPAAHSVPHQILESELMLSNAHKEIIVAKTLSSFMQEAAQRQVETITSRLQSLRESAPPEKELTYAAMDKKRADAVQLLQGWDARKCIKEDQTNHEVQITMVAIDDAVAALHQQKTALQDRYRAHQAAWLTINAAHRQAQCSKIAELEARCNDTKANESFSLAG